MKDFGAFFVLVVVIAVFSSSFDLRNGRVTVYPALCDQPTVAGICQGKVVETAPWEVYRADFSEQRVVRKVHDVVFTVGGPEDCTVFDSENWSCFRGGEYYQAASEMQDGSLRTWLNLKGIELPNPPREV